MIGIIGLIASALGAASVIEAAVLPCGLLGLNDANHAIQQFVCGLGAASGTGSTLDANLDCMVKATADKCAAPCGWCKYTAENVGSAAVDYFGAGACILGESMCEIGHEAVKDIAALAQDKAEYFPIVPKHAKCIQILKKADCEAKAGCTAFAIDPKYKIGTPTLCLDTSELGLTAETIQAQLTLKDTATPGETTTLGADATTVTTRLIQQTTSSTTANTTGTSGALQIGAMQSVALTIITAALAYSFVI